MNTETILNTIQLWKEHPEKAQVRPAVTARADESRAVIEAGSFSWHADSRARWAAPIKRPAPRCSC